MTWWGTLYKAGENSTTNAAYFLNGTYNYRVEGTDVYNWGITEPSVAPVLAAGASTGLNGTYNVKYTYVRKDGATVVGESNPSPAGTAVALSNQSLSITWTASGDAQVTHVRLYRTLATPAAEIFYYLTEVAIGTTTTDDATADASLGSEVATDHDLPPAGEFIFGPSYNGTLFIPLNNLLYYCKPKEPENWPSTYFIEICEPQFPVKSGVYYNGQVYLLNLNRIFYVQGTSHPNFFSIPMESMTGVQSKSGVEAVHGFGIFHVGPDGIYLFSGQDQNFTRAKFQRIFRGETVNDVPGVSDLTKSWLVQWHGRLYFGYTSTGYTYPTNILVFDLTNGRTTYYNYNNTEFTFASVDNTNDRLVATDTSGYLWRLEDPTVKTDNGTAISWELESKDFVLSTRRHFPRWVKYDVDASDDTCSATGKIVMDGEIHQQHTIKGDRQTNRRLIKSGNAKRNSIRISGTGKVKVYAAEAE